MLNNQGRPTQAGEAHGVARETFTGNRALEIDEALIFDQGGFDRTGVVPRSLASAPASMRSRCSLESATS